LILWNNFGGSFSLRFVANRYILQQKCLKKLIVCCLLVTRRYNFNPLHRPEHHNAQRYRQTDRQTDRRTDGQTTLWCQEAVILCAVRSAKMSSERAPVVCLNVDDVVEVKTDDDLVVWIEQKYSATVDRQNDVITRQRRSANAICLKHGREVSRPYWRRAGDHLALYLHTGSHVIEDCSQSHGSYLYPSSTSYTFHKYLSVFACLVR